MSSKIANYCSLTSDCDKVRIENKIVSEYKSVSLNLLCDDVSD